MRRRRATVAKPGEWQCKTGGVRWLAVANGPDIFQMLLVVSVKATDDVFRARAYRCMCIRDRYRT